MARSVAPGGEPVIRIRRSSTKGWTQVQNTVLRDPALSLKAKGLLVQLLSHEDGWQQSITFCARECSDGRDAIKAALRELEAAGYVLRSKRQGAGGRWVWDHEVADARIYAGSPSTEVPSTESPSPEKASIDVEALDDKALDVEPQDTSKTARRASFDNRPDDDQIYLARVLSDTWEQNLSVKALQRLNNLHGRVAVTHAMQSVRGFPPSEAIRSLYAYVADIAANDGAVSA